MSYLGLDVGTTGCKAGVFDAEGRLLALAYREYPMLSPKRGWAEIDSEEVCRLCFEVVREAAGDTPGDPVRAVGISSQGEAFTPVARDGTFLANAMVSSDARAASLAESWNGGLGAERLYRITGHTPHPMFSLFKLRWLREHCPDVWDAAAKFYCFEELLHLRFGLEPAISWPLAGRTMMFNVTSHRWEEEILDAVGLTADRLAPPVPSGTKVGTIASRIARELGLPEGVAVVAGGHDQTCAALGAGAVSHGVAMYATGTTECICPALAEPVFQENLFRNNVCTYDYTAEGMYTTVLFSLTGGNLLRWFRDQWAQPEREEADATGADPYDLLVDRMPDKPTDLLVLPYFTPSGTPYFDSRVPGAVLGLRLSTTRGEVLRGLLEGVAMEMRLNVDLLDRAGLHLTEFRATGGGAKNAALTQLKADVLGRPVTKLSVSEAGCLGAAMLGCAADTGSRVEQLAADWVRFEETIDPDPTRADYYRQRFASYRDLYPALRGLDFPASEKRR